MSGRSVNLTTLFLGRLRSPKRLTSTSCTYFRQWLTTALLEKAEGETKVCCQTGYRTQDLWLTSQVPYRLRYAAWPLWDNISVYIGRLPKRGRKRREMIDESEMSKQPTPAPTASAVGPCPTVIKTVGRPGTGSLPSTFAPPDHSQWVSEHCLSLYYLFSLFYNFVSRRFNQTF